MKDVLPPEVSKWQFVEEKARQVLESFAFRELRSLGTLDRAYVVHARWEHEPVTRWYRLERSGDRPRIEAAVFGPRTAAADAELIGMAVGMLAELGIPGGRRSLTVNVDQEARALLATLKIAHEPGNGTGTFFEIRTGAHRLAAGARNDELIASLGGPPVPAMLLEVDLDPLIAAVDEPAESFEPPLTAYFACDSARARAWALQTAHRLRLDGVRAEIDHDDVPLDEQRARASALGARLAVVVRDEDLHAGRVLVEDHGTDRREMVAMDEVDSTIRQRVD